MIITLIVIFAIVSYNNLQIPVWAVALAIVGVIIRVTIFTFSFATKVLMK